MPITKEAIEQIAHSSMGVHNPHNERTFRAHFVFSSLCVAVTWNLLIRQELLPHRAQPWHLLWFLFFVKEYPNKEVGATACHCDRNTFEKWWKAIGKAVASLDVVSIKMA